MFDLAKYEEKIDKLIRDDYTCSYMSNSKWIKLFKALDTDEITLNHVSLKKISNLDSFFTYMPKSEDLDLKWVTEGYNECKYFYKEIEWVEFVACYKPSDIPAEYEYQSIDLVRNVISSIGLFQVEESLNGLKVFGYKKT